MSDKLRQFLDSINEKKPAPPQDDYQTIVKQLSAISWQLKRIADVLEGK
jgi:hypothetical protein